ncbi:FK506-binding protein 3 [Sitophilus oryzae]|uniref:FK506-binding protein 3 n=1 Tax=Sitophilus oryzae TaxID=7048 RepID=A0A6J2YU46_SITOR|nr:FK506-binding protein 3 [Sitophilus oryzae]
MADTEAQKKVESTVDEEKVEKKTEEVVEKSESEEKKTENGEENGKEQEESEEVKDDTPKDKCSIKRKSTGTDSLDAKTEETTPEKKAKLDEAVIESKANGEVTEAEATA